jgi:hypothetical protein
MNEIPTAVVVPNRSQTRRLDWMDMRCSEREIPNFVQDYAANYWLSAMAGFVGTARVVGGDGESLELGHETRSQGTAAIGIDKGRLIAIVSPNDAMSPAVWINAPLAELKAEAMETSGLFKKKPKGLEISLGDHWNLILGQVSRYYRKRNAQQARQEASLLEALA